MRGESRAGLTGSEIGGRAGGGAPLPLLALRFDARPGGCPGATRWRRRSSGSRRGPGQAREGPRSPRTRRSPAGNLSPRRAPLPPPRRCDNRARCVRRLTHRDALPEQIELRKQLRTGLPLAGDPGAGLSRLLHSRGPMKATTTGHDLSVPCARVASVLHHRKRRRSSSTRLHNRSGSRPDASDATPLWRRRFDRWRKH